MEEKKNLPMKPIDQKDLKIIKHVYKKAGQLQAFAFMGHTVQVQIAQILKELHDNDYYKEIGYGTWEEVCEELDISRSRSYKLMGNLKIAGSAVVELMYRAGFSTYDQYLMLKSRGEIEDAEFEILSEYEIKIKGETFSVIDNPQEAVECMCRLKHERDRAKRAMKDTERELEETKKDLEQKKRKIEFGEKQRGKFELTEFDKALSEFTTIAKILYDTEWTEKDLRLVKRHYHSFFNDVVQPFNGLFADKTRDLEAIESGKHCRREDDPCEEDQEENINEEDQA